MKNSAMRPPKPAYIFGGLEAFLLQGLIGGLLGGALVVKGYWQRIKSYFSGGSEPVGPGTQEQSEQTDDTP